jgi:photosystem II stability/assembly factor-like uncharacterized protein
MAPGAPPRQLVDQEEVDPDLPGFAVGLVDKETYHQLRDLHIGALRGLPYPDRDARVRAIREMQARMQAQFRDPRFSTLEWSPIGPAPLPNGQTEIVSTPVSGRVIAIAVDPTNPNIVYVGAAQGGVYRSLDGGTTWEAIFDSAASLAIGSIAIAPSNPSVVFVGTGEPNLACDSFFGVGIYRIDNAKTTPILSGPFNKDGSNADVFTGRSVGRIVVHPTDPNTIFATTTSGIGGLGCEAYGGGFVPPLPGRGLFRSTNALSGAPTFTKLTTATGVNVLPGNLSHVDVAIDPSNPNRVLTTVFAPTTVGVGTGGGVYLSTDALAPSPTFTRTLIINNFRSELALHAGGGLTTVYAASGDGSGVAPCASSGTLRRSDDGGAAWSPPLAGGDGFCQGQCFYNIAVAVAPDNANSVLLGGQITNACGRLIARSTDGGTSFTNANSGVHADNHAAAFAPSNSSIAYIGTDGGIYKSTDGGQSWTSLNNSGFSATQFQSLAMHPTHREFMIGGTQDNGTEFLEPTGPTSALWRRADFGDGGFALIDQNATDTTNVTMYHTYFNVTNAMAYARVTSTADATEGNWAAFGCGFGGITPNGMTCPATAVLFYAPMALGPGTPNTVYFGSDRLWRSVDQGTTMALASQAPIESGQAITAIGISPQNELVRILGLRNGHIYRTTTGSTVLDQVTGAGMPARFIGRAVIDPNNQNTAYVTFTGFAVPAGQHVWKTTNLDAVTPTWNASGTGIPDVPANAFVVDPINSNNLYAGTDIGVYSSTDGGATWAPFSTGLPVVAVFDLAIQNTHRVLRAATHGRGIWERSLDSDLIFADGVEFGAFGNWDVANQDGGDLSVSGAAALHGALGIAALADDTNSIFVQDNTPNDEPRYRARFLFDPNTFDPGEALGKHRTRIFLGLDQTPSTRRALAIVLRRVGGAFGIMVRVLTDDGGRVQAGFFPITDAPHSIQVDWKRSSAPGANDGSLQLWIDEVSVATIQNIDNDGVGIDAGRPGILSAKPGAGGTIFLDKFESRRVNFINP